MKLNYFITCIAFSFFFLDCTEKNNIDPITKIEIDSINSQIKKLIDVAPDSVYTLAQNNLSKAIQNRNKFLECAMIAKLSNYYLKKGDYYLCDSFNQKALNLSSILDYNEVTANSYSNIAQLAHMNSDLVTAFHLHKKALEFAKSVNEHTTVRNELRAIAKILILQKNNEEALLYAKQSLTYHPDDAGSKEVAYSYMAIGDAMYYTNKDSALYYYNKSYNEIQKLKYPYASAIVLSRWAWKFYPNDMNNCLRKLLEADSLFCISYKGNSFHINTLGNIGTMLLETAYFDSNFNKLNIAQLPHERNALYKLSEKYLLQSITEGKKIKSYTDVSYFTNQLSMLYEERKNYTGALTFLKESNTISDSLYSQKNKNAIAKLEAEKDVLKFKSESESKSNRIKWLIGSLCALLIISFFIFRNYRNRQKLQQQLITQLEQEKRIVSIDGLLKGQEEERGRLAKDLHDGLGGLLSGIKLSFTNMKESLVMKHEDALVFNQALGQLEDSIAELRKVSHNLMPEVLSRYGLEEAIKEYCNNLQHAHHIHIQFQKVGNEAMLSQTQENNIYRIVQECVNNSIKHGECKSILVQLSYNQTNVMLTIEDDGKGFDTKDKVKRKGIGMMNIEQRVSYLNGLLEVNSKPNEGTEIHIEIKL